MILHRYVFGQLALAMAASLGGLLLVLVPPLILSAISRLGGVGGAVLLGYMPYLGLELLPYLLPLSFLLAVTATFSRMAGNGEWTAIQMAGIHPARAALPGLGLALLCSGSFYYLLHFELPQRRFEQSAYKRSAAVDVLRRLLPGKTTIQAGEFLIASKRRHGNTFEDVSIRIPRDDGEKPAVMLAETLHMRADEDGLFLAPRNLRVFEDDATFSIETLTYYLAFDDFVPIQRPDPRVPKYMGTRALRAKASSMDAGAPGLHGHLYEIHKRHALAASYLLFLLLGVPVGLRLRTTSLLAPLSVAAICSCVYYVVSLRLGKEIALTGAFPPWLGAWSANAVAALAACFLLFLGRRR